ncbi:hypothetical protein [Nocardia alni]|uniref:hypothetical protein n=1 Tax=Nocardia alni TaxID=2815723 RepID=UPI001C246FCA|nr:hypothetical protein [Nocardia alni]
MALGVNPRRVEVVRAFARSIEVVLPPGMTPLRPDHAIYVQIDEWTPEAHDHIETIHPFPIKIPWDDLAY